MSTPPRNPPLPAPPRSASAAPPSDRDRQLVELIQAGTDVEQNFERLHKRHLGRLLRYFGRLGFSQAESEELTQETFVRVFKSIGRFRHESHFARWLFEIAANAYRNELRRLHAHKRGADEVPLDDFLAFEKEQDPQGTSGLSLASSTANPYEEASAHQQAAALSAAIARLPPQMRSCLMLRAYQGLKYREIANIMSIKIDTVKAHLYQAKERLQRDLGAKVVALSAVRDPAQPHAPGDPGADDE